jgi:hypothetical protein
MQNSIENIQRRKSGIISFVDSIKKGDPQYVNDQLISMSVDYRMNMSTQLSFSIVDQDLKMFKSNFFQVGRRIKYSTKTISSPNAEGVVVPSVQSFEIATVTMSQGPGASPVFNITCYSTPIQQMKRDKNPKNISGSGSEYARRAAAKYGLKFYGENTSKRKQISNASGSKQAESVWDVISGIATEAEFVVYEVDGYLIFASQKYLLKKWGTVRKNIKDKKAEKYIPVYFNPDKNKQAKIKPTNQEIILLNYPTIDIRENSPFDAEGTLTVDRVNGTQLRPGMTIKMSDFGNFNGYYIIDGVSFSELSPDPVTVTFRNPTVQEKDVKQLPVGKIAKKRSVIKKDKDPTVNKKRAGRK